MNITTGEEEWRSIPIDGFRDRYEASDFGRIRNIQFPKVLSPKISTTGYKTLKLHSDGKETQFKVHRLVALAFVPKPPMDRDLLVNHINGDKLDNRATNLEWATKSSNAAHAHAHLRHRKRRGIIYAPSSNELGDETWLGINHPKFPLLQSRYEISNLGRVRRLSSGRGTSSGKLISNHELGGYIGITLLPTKGKAKTFHLHLLVAWTFLPPPEVESGKPIVDHIDSNPMNPRASNLRWVTYRQNAVYGFGKLTPGHVDEIRKAYASRAMSQNELALKFAISQQQVSKVLRGRQRGLSAITQDLRTSVTPEQVNEIRRLGAKGDLTLITIAARFAVTANQVANILSGRCWSGIPYSDGNPWEPIPRRTLRRTNPRRKLSQQDVEAIKLAYLPGETTQEDIAKKYGVDRTVISRIVGKSRRRIR